MFGDLLFFVAVLAGVAIVAIFLNKRLLTLLLSSVFLLLVAMRLNITQMYLMGTVLLALPLASYMVGWISGRNLEVTRHVPPSAIEGEVIPIRVDVQSPMPLFSGLVRVNKHLPRYVRAVPDSDVTTPLANGVRQEYSVRAERRGLYKLAGCTVTLHDPLGIFMITRRFPLSSSLVVYPSPLPANSVGDIAGGSGGWIVQSSTGYRGDETGFYRTREYRVGDDLRRIHWKSSARAGDLVVVEREQGSSGRTWVALDTLAGSGLGSGSENTLERGIKLAVTLVEAALGRGDSVGLVAPGESGGIVPLGSGDLTRLAILEILARVQANGTELLGEALAGMTVTPGATVAIITGAPTQAILDEAGTMVSRRVGVLTAAVEPAPDAKPAPYDVLSPEGFTSAAESSGAQSFILRAAGSAEAVAV